MILNDEQINDLNVNGFTIIRNMINENWVNNLKESSELAFIEHKKYQDIDGVAINAILSSNTFIDFVEYLISIDFIKSLELNFFKSKCILNSLSALDNINNIPNFSSKVHRDLRFFSGSLPVMINCLLMLDDFTIENGATYILPKSHLLEDKPSDEYFFNNSIQTIGKSGDILIFNSNLWHASAPNKTTDRRRAIPFTISRSFMKQLMDYSRAIGYDRIDIFSYQLQQFLGYHSRVPSSIDEWYQKDEKRFYKKDQD